MALRPYRLLHDAFLDGALRLRGEIVMIEPDMASPEMTPAEPEHEEEMPPSPSVPRAPEASRAEPPPPPRR